jgi:protein transport protein SEC13
MQHDVQPDFYGKRVATCSSDRTIRIFELATPAEGAADAPAGGDGAQQLSTAADAAVLQSELKGHEGPVWRVAWGHPKFGTLLASCGYDCRVFIWAEGPVNHWNCVYTYEGHSGSVNSIAWAPHEFGLCLATASSDGSIAILTQRSGSARDTPGWEVQVIPDAHPVGVNAVSWSPGVNPGALVSSAASEQADNMPSLVSGGCDCKLHIWRPSGPSGADGPSSWKRETTLEHHTDWVRDVSWAPNCGVPMNTIASGGQDGLAVIWTQKAGQDEWEKCPLPKFPDTVWSTSWSLTGSVLAVCSGSDQVTLFKEQPDGSWETVSSVDATA